MIITLTSCHSHYSSRHSWDFSFLGIRRSGFHTVVISKFYLTLHIRCSWEPSFLGVGRSGYRRPTRILPPIAHQLFVGVLLFKSRSIRLLHRYLSRILPLIAHQAFMGVFQGELKCLNLINHNFLKVLDSIHIQLPRDCLIKGFLFGVTFSRLHTTKSIPRIPVLDFTFQSITQNPKYARI